MALSSPTNSSCQPSMPDFCIPPPVPGVGPGRPAAPRNVSASAVLGAADAVPCNPTLTAAPAGQLHGEGREAAGFRGFVHAGDGTCALSLPIPGSAVVCADQSGRNVPLPGTPGLQSVPAVPTPLHPASSSPCGERQAECAALALSSPLPPPVHRVAHQTLHCVALSNVFVS